MKRLLLLLLLPSLAFSQLERSGRRVLGLPGLSRAGVSWLLRDDFYVPLSAGSVNGSTASDGASVRTSAGNTFIASNALQMPGTSTAAWGSEGVWYASRSRVQGMIFAGTFIQTIFGANGTMTGWAQATGTTVNFGHGYYWAGGSIFAYENGASVGLGTYNAYLPYRFSVALKRTAGAQYFLNGGTEYPFMRLVWVGDVANVATLYPTVTNHSSYGHNTANCIPRTYWLAAPVASDSPSVASTSNGTVLAQTDGRAHAEGVSGGVGSGGGSVPYTINWGSWTVSSGVAYGDTASTGRAIATVNSPSSNMFCRVQFTRSAGVAGMVLRFVDTLNYVRVEANATTLSLIAVTNGTPSTKGSAAYTYSDNTNLTALISDSIYSIYYGSSSILSNVTFSGFSGTRFGYYSTNVANGFRKFQLYYTGNEGQYNDLAGLVGSAPSQPAHSEDISAFAQVAPNDSVRVGSASIGGAAGELIKDYLFFGHAYRVRLNGPIRAAKMYVANKANMTGLYLKVWRRIDSTHYSLIWTSDNCVDKVGHKQISTFTVDTTGGSGIQNGDFIGCGVTWSTAGKLCFFQASNLPFSSGMYRYSVVGGIDTTGGYNWAAATAKEADGAFGLEVYGDPPYGVVVGNSLAAGSNANQGFLSPSDQTDLSHCISFQLDSLIGKPIENMGYGGLSIVQVDGFMQRRVLDLKPKIAVIDGGINDIARDSSFASFIGAWTSIIAKCQAAGIMPIALKMFPANTYADSTRSERRDSWNRSLDSLCALRGVVCVDMTDTLGTFRSGGPAGNKWNLKTEYDGGDHLHLNEDGYRAVALEIKRRTEGLLPNP